MTPLTEIANTTARSLHDTTFYAAESRHMIDPCIEPARRLRPVRAGNTTKG